MAGELGVFDHRRALEEQLLGGSVLQAFSQAAGAKNGAQFVEAHFLADIEEEQADGGATQGRISRRFHRDSLTRRRRMSEFRRSGSIFLASLGVGFATFAVKSFLTAEDAKKCAEDAKKSLFPSGHIESRWMQLKIEKLIYGGCGVGRLPADADVAGKRAF